MENRKEKRATTQAPPSKRINKKHLPFRLGNKDAVCFQYGANIHHFRISQTDKLTKQTPNKQISFLASPKTGTGKNKEPAKFSLLLIEMQISQ